MQCSKCNSTEGEYKNGISKKNNRPWRGWKCAKCNEMNWLKSDASPQAVQPVLSGNPADIVKVITLLEDIKAILCAKLLGGKAPSKPAKTVELDQDGFPIPEETV